MAEYYSIVSDEDELKRFFDSVLSKLDSGESYMMCLSCRLKKLTEEQKQIYGVGRSEMMRTFILRKRKSAFSFEQFKEAVYSYECRKEGLITSKGLPYPENGLVLYMYLNPCSEVECVDDTVNYALTIKTELVNSCLKHSSTAIDESIYKLSKTFEHLKSCHTQHPSRKMFIDFDLDVDFTNEKEAIPAIRNCAEKFFQKGNFWLVRTTGGIHIIVRSSVLKFNPNNFITDLTDSVWKESFGQIKECIYNKNCIIPIPGTFQYKNPVHILNWDDFDNQNS